MNCLTIGPSWTGSRDIPRLMITEKLSTLFVPGLFSSLMVYDYRSESESSESKSTKLYSGSVVIKIVVATNKIKRRFQLLVLRHEESPLFTIVIWCMNSETSRQCSQMWETGHLGNLRQRHWTTNARPPRRTLPKEWVSWPVLRNTTKSNGVRPSSLALRVSHTLQPKGSLVWDATSGHTSVECPRFRRPDPSPFSTWRNTHD